MTSPAVRTVPALMCAALLSVALTGCSLRGQPAPQPPTEVLNLSDAPDVPPGWVQHEEEDVTYALPAEGWTGRASHTRPRWTWYGPPAADGAERLVADYRFRDHAGEPFGDQAVDIAVDPRHFRTFERRPVHVAGARSAAVQELTWRQTGGFPVDDGGGDTERAGEGAVTQLMRERQLRIITEGGTLRVWLVRGPDAEFAVGGPMQRIYDSYQLRD